MSFVAPFDISPDLMRPRSHAAAWAVPGLIAASLAVIASTVLRAWWEQTPVGSFLGEQTFATYYVGALLLVTGVASLALSIGHVLTATGGRHHLPLAVAWALIGVTFAVMAGDEVWQFHERLDRKIHALLTIDETRLTDRLDDLIVAGYGVFIVAVLFVVRRAFSRYRRQWRLVVVAAGLCLLTALLDVATNDAAWMHDVLSDEVLAVLFYDLRVTEEYVKVLAAGLLLAVVLLCLDSDAHPSHR